MTKMFEYEMMNKTTNELIFIWGHDFKNALKRNPSINPNEWECLSCEYVD